MKRFFSSMPTPEIGFCPGRLLYSGYIGIVAATLVIQGCSKGNSRDSARQDAAPVVVATVMSKTVPVEVRGIGNVEASSTIAVRSQVSGEMARVYFTEGEFVRKGQPLFLIDPRPYEAQVSQAQANLARDTAQLSQAKSNLARDIAQERFAKNQAERYSELLGQGVLSKAQYDEAQSNADARTEAVRADQAAIESAQAATDADKAVLALAKLELGYCTILSPIDGRTGDVLVNQGNLVTANGTPLTTIHQIQPIYATFSVPEKYLPDIRKFIAEGKLTVLASQPDDASPSVKGVLAFVDNAVDFSTGTIKLKGVFPNEDRRLWPGQFINVVLQLTTHSNTMVVPTQAIQTGLNRQFVFVVKSDLTVETRSVEVGMQINQEVVIEKGLQPGETVVTEGQLRLVPGAPVSVPNAAEANPKPSTGL